MNGHLGSRALSRRAVSLTTCTQLLLKFHDFLHKLSNQFPLFSTMHCSPANKQPIKLAFWRLNSNQLQRELPPTHRHPAETERSQLGKRASAMDLASSITDLNTNQLAVWKHLSIFCPLGKFKDALCCCEGAQLCKVMSEFVQRMLFFHPAFRGVSVSEVALNARAILSRLIL